MLGRRSGFREKIAILIALPVAVIVLAGVPLLAARMDDVRAAAVERDSARVAVEIAPLLRSLAAERALSLAGVALVIEPRDALLRRQAETREFTAAALRGLADIRVPELQAGLTDLAALEEIRTGVLARTAPATDIVVRYGAAIGTVLSGSRLDDAGAAATLLAAERRDAVGAALLWAAVDPARSVDASLAATDAAAAASVYLRGYGLTGDPTGGPVDALVVSSTEQAVDELVRALRSDPVAFAAAGRNPVTDLLAVNTAAAVPRGMTSGSLLAEAATAAADRARVAVAVAVGIGIVLAAFGAGVIVVGLRIATSVSRPLRVLAAAAGEVADIAGRELMRVADTEDVDAPAPTLAAVNISGDDELGDFAGAFNRVQAVAALLLERQVLIRRNSASMLGHVGRRTRTLVARQLSIIDSLERSEQDAERLERLYRLDHVTSRLRRNADSLLVLASAGEHDLGNEPQPVVTVIRSAIATIEGFQRVSLGEMLNVLVHPPLLADVTLLIAELLENAVAFSPPGTDVLVRAVPAAGGGCRVEIVDHGVGMSRDEMARYNERLRSPERLELGSVEVLGLLVVGRIARRHAIVVTLVPSRAAGVTALVDLARPALVTRSTGPRHGRVPDLTAGDVTAGDVTAGDVTARDLPAAGVAAGAAGYVAARDVGPKDVGPWDVVPRDVGPPPLPHPVANGNGGLFRALTSTPPREPAPAPNGASRTNGHVSVPSQRAGSSGPAAGPPGRRSSALPPPPGAHGLNRRVPGAQAPSGVEPVRPAPPLLGVVDDAEAARRFVDELEAGVTRAIEQVRAEQAHPTIEEQRDV